MKKLTALLLTMAICIASLPMLTFAESNVTLTTFDDVSEVTDLSTRIASTENLALNSTLSDTYGQTGYVNFNHSEGSRISASNFSKLFNGIAEDVHFDITGFNHLDSSGNYVDDPVDFTFNFDGKATITSFAYIGRSKLTGQEASYIEEYALFASDSLSSLYESTNEVFHYNNTFGKTSQYCSFTTPIKAQYFGMRIYKAVNKSYANRTYAYLRSKEIAIFGTCNTAGDITNPNDATLIKNTIAKLNTSENILKDGYSVFSAQQPNITVSGRLKGVDNSSASFHSYQTELDFLDGDPTTHTDISLSTNPSFYFIDSQGNYNENTYIDLKVSLKHSTIINGIFMAFPVRKYWQAAEFNVYASSSESDLFADKSIVKAVSAPATQDSPYYSFVFETPITAKYVGIRFIKGVKDPQGILTDYKTHTVAYLRFAEFAIFGKYDLPYYDCTATSNRGNYLNESFNTYSGKEYEYKVPYFSGNDEFDHFEINGKTAESETSKRNNYAKIKGTVDENHTNFVAVYKDKSAKLSSGKYTITDSNIIVPYGELKYELLSNLNECEDNISVKNNGTELKKGDRLVNGDKIELTSGVTPSVTDQKEIVVKGDINADKDMTVTDIVKTINGILENNLTDNEKISADINEDGKNTVSDIVGLRNSIFTKPDYLKCYQEKVENISEFKCKNTGRTMVTADGAVTYDFTGSGIEFNLNCAGDVSLTVAQTSEEFTYYNITVDGVTREERLYGVGNKQTLLLAQGLEKGNHSFKVFKQRCATHTLKLYTVSYMGESLQAPENKDLFIEFLGDSITCGVGNLVTGGEVSISIRHENGLEAYAVQTARELDCDYSCVAKGGFSMVDVPNSAGVIPKVYNQIVLFDSEHNYNFDAARKPDVIVINLGTNDESRMSELGYTTEQKKALMKSSTESFVDTLISIWGNDINIVLSYGMMSNAQYIHDTYQEVAQAYTAKGHNVFNYKLRQGGSGGSGHPTTAQSRIAAQELASFITNTVLTD